MKSTLKSFALIASILGFLSLAACNTVEGVGKDLQSGGKELQKASQNNKQSKQQY